MEKDITSHSVIQLYPIITLYLDDVEAIYRIVTEVSEQVEIKTEGYKFASPDLLTKLPVSQTDKLSVNGHSAHVSVEVFRRHIHVYGATDTLAIRGAVAAIMSVLSKRRHRWLERLGSVSLIASVASLGIMLGILLLVWLLRGMPTVPWIGPVLVAWLLSVAYVTVMAIVRSPKRPIVVFKYSTESPSFFKRHGDQLILILITAVVSSVASVLGTLLIQSLTRQAP